MPAFLFCLNYEAYKKQNNPLTNFTDKIVLSQRQTERSEVASHSIISALSNIAEIGDGVYSEPDGLTKK